MSIPPRLGLSEAEKDSLLFQQQEMIERMAARISELEALVGKPRKTSTNSHIPPSKDGFGRKKRGKTAAGKRPPREGKARPLADTPDKTERVIADACGHCGTNNISEREIRPSVVFRKVTNGFRSDWGAQIHAGHRSVTGTARLTGKSALDAIRDLVDGNFAVA